MIEIGRLERLLNEACDCAERLETLSVIPAKAVSEQIQACLHSLTGAQQGAAAPGGPTPGST
jgi:hypothetical protein